MDQYLNSEIEKGNLDTVIVFLYLGGFLTILLFLV